LRQAEVSCYAAITLIKDSRLAAKESTANMCSSLRDG
jgi:hypothetical protein